MITYLACMPVYHMVLNYNDRHVTDNWKDLNYLLSQLSKLSHPSDFLNYTEKKWKRYTIKFGFLCHLMGNSQKTVLLYYQDIWQKTLTKIHQSVSFDTRLVFLYVILALSRKISMCRSKTLWLIRKCCICDALIPTNLHLNLDTRSEINVFFLHAVNYLPLI